jgi:CHASE2 domain-containing sensor protein
VSAEGTARALRSPFLGLLPFGDSETDGALFAGREEEIDLVAANLRAAKLTTFYGPSGVGKSSLLRAGVARRIRIEADAARAAGRPAPTVIVSDEWAGDPAAVLARRIADEAGDETPDLALDVAIARWCAERTGVLLLIFDQFEEYLRLHPAPGAKDDAFDRLFPEIAGRLDLRVHILISLRDDALAELDRFEGRVPNLFDNYLRLPPMTLPAARRAIEGPIATVNEWRVAAGLPPVDVGAGLVDDVLEQLTDQRRWSPEAGLAAPPAEGEAVEPAFLQLVMKRLWDVDSGRRPPVLRRSTLVELGGADAIVRDHLDSAMAALTRSQRETAAEAFGYLVTPSGAKIRYTAEDLADPLYADRPVAEVRDVLEALAEGQARIIRKVPAPSGEQAQGYEIFHDVLAHAVRAWAERQRRARLERRTARLAGGLVAAIAIGAGLLAYAARPVLLQKLELRTDDARFGLRGARRPDPKIAVVALDDRTLRAMPAILDNLRAADARVISRVSAGAPAAIAVDFQYKLGGRPGTPALIGALRRARHVVLATFRVNEDGNTTLFGVGPQRTFYSATTGYSGFPREPGGVVRHVRSEAKLQLAPGQALLPTVENPTATQPVGLPTLALAAARIAGDPVDTATFPKGDGAWIDFAGPPGTYRPISYLDVLRGAVPPQTFRGRIVVIGETDRGAQDRFRAPGGVMAGPEIHANAIATVRGGLPLRDAGAPVPVALIVILPLLCCALALRSTLRRALLASALAGLLVLVGAQLAFDAGRVVTLVYPLLALALAAVGSVIAARATRVGRPKSSAGSSAARDDAARPTEPAREEPAAIRQPA